MKNILIIVLSDLKHDARVRRQINALKGSYSLTVAAFDGPENDGYQLIRLPSTKINFQKKATSSFFLLSRMYSIAFRILHNHGRFLHQQTSNIRFDLIIANDVETLPIAFSFPGKPKVIFDAHEYAPRHFENKRMWRIFFQGFNTWICRKYIPKTSAMMTVGRGLAEEYQKNFGVTPVIITNASPLAGLSPSPVADERIRLVHHGIVNASRSLHLMADMMQLLGERFSLDLYLLIPQFAAGRTHQYLESLKERAAATKNMRILPPIPGAELVKKLNDYDIGVFLLPPVNFNYENTLPNKLFDFIQARLGVAIGPTREMADIVRTFKNGVVAKEFTAGSLAEELKKLSANDVRQFKVNSSTAAEIHNAENNAIRLQELVASVLS